MISKNNLFFFEDNDSFSSIHKLFQKLAESERNIKLRLKQNENSSMTQIIKLLNNYNYELLNVEEKQSILNLLKNMKNSETAF